MSVAPAEPTPNEPQTGGTPPAATPEAPPAAKPPWGDDFDAEKAWKLVEGLRSDKEKLAAREFLTPEQKTKLAEYDRLEAASKTELEKAQEAASKATERINAVTQRAVTAEVKALAADKFADPSDAAAFLDLKKYSKEDGDIDTAAIAADLADLIEKKPHLGKPAGPADPRAPRPNPAQGASGSGAAEPPQLTRDDVERLAKEGKHAEIEKARLEGRLTQLMTTKS